MSLRPQPARWFDLVVAREDCDVALEVLARQAQVELTRSRGGSPPEPLAALGGPIRRYRELSRQYSPLWPVPVQEPLAPRQPAEDAARAALDRIERWRAGVQARIAEVRRLEAELERLRAWEQILPGLARSPLYLRLLRWRGPVLAGVCAVVPRGAARELPPACLALAVPVGDECAWLGLVRREAIGAFCAAAAGAQGRCLAVPECFGASVPETLARTRARREAIEGQIQSLAERVRTEAVRTRLPQALGLLQRLEWLLGSAESVACDAAGCHLAGWTSEADAARLGRRLERAGVCARLDFPAPPAGETPPSVLRNPRWLQPFEWLTRTVGVPGLREADPTTWLAFLVPLLFGFMCGDAGHGLLFVGLGLYLARRTELGWLLVFCGGAAVPFGLLYGDVLGLEGLVEPLWVRPLDEPLTILTAAVGVGAGVLTLALVLRALQSFWRDRPGYLWVADGGLLLAYWGALLAYFYPALLALSALGLLAAVAVALAREPRARTVLWAAARFLLGTGELLFHTLSFIRIGAFALAHAGLSSVVTTLAGDVADPILRVTLTALGQLVVLAIEGTLLSIQTTRLILFEFFMPFFRGEGRPIERLAPPASPPAGGGTT